MNRKKKLVVAAAAAAWISILTLSSALAAPEVYKIDPNHSSVSFTIRHLVSRVPGRFNTFGGEIVIDKENPAASKVTAEIETRSIDTATGKRDDHLRSPDFFDVEKFPKMSFVSRSVNASSKDHSTITGDLTLKGVTKPVTLDVTWLGFAGPKAGFEAKTSINRKDFGIIWNRALDQGGAMLGDEVDVTILIEAMSVEAMKEPPAKPPAPPAPPPATSK